MIKRRMAVALAAALMVLALAGSVSAVRPPATWPCGDPSQRGKVSAAFWIENAADLERYVPRIGDYESSVAVNFGNDVAALVDRPAHVVIIEGRFDMTELTRPPPGVGWPPAHDVVKVCVDGESTLFSEVDLNGWSQPEVPVPPPLP